MFSNLYETHINVPNLERSMEFYGGKLELELGTLAKERRVAFYFIGGWGKTMLGVWEKPPEQVLPQHLAFEVPPEELEAKADELRKKGIVTLDFFGQESDVPTIFGWMPAIAVYFADPDGHLLEIIARLPDEPQPNRMLIPYEEWKGGQRRSTPPSNQP